MSWLCLWCELITIPLIEVETARASLWRQKSDLNNLSATTSLVSYICLYWTCLFWCYIGHLTCREDTFKAANKQNRVNWLTGSAPTTFWLHFDLEIKIVLSPLPLSVLLNLLWINVPLLPFKDGSFFLEASDRDSPLKCSEWRILGICARV